MKKVKKKPAPWLTSKVKKLMNERDQLLRKSRRTKREDDISKYRRMRNEVYNAVRRAKYSYHKESLQANCKNPSKFWKTLKPVYPTK